jgi:hypothetical protein
MNYPTIMISESDMSICVEHAKKMCRGAKTKNFKHGTLQGEDVYTIGKVGEFAVGKWLKELGVAILHKPFRESYEYFNPDDDFIIEVNGNQKQLEVRTKARSVDPGQGFDCCSDCIKPHLTYVFVSYNRTTCEASIVGFANEALMRQKARPVLRGSENSNFSHKANEYNIMICDLAEPSLFMQFMCLPVKASN